MKIEVEDLMVGDWVYIKDYPIIARAMQVKKEHFVRSLVEFEPISLTAEILEKNGFKEDFESNGIYWRPDCRKFCIVKELGTWYFAFRLIGEIFDKSSGYICISECNYVHKLQHKLKDLEIEKEIVL